MVHTLDAFFAGEPMEWLEALPAYQKFSLGELLAAGRDYDQAAEAWLTASAANTFRLGAGPALPAKDTFLAHVKREVRAFLCGDPRYAKERAGLFGDTATTRTMIVSAIAVALSPHVGMAVAVLTPIVALVLASMGKITLNAWCASTAEPPVGGAS